MNLQINIKFITPLQFSTMSQFSYSENCTQFISTENPSNVSLTLAKDIILPIVTFFGGILVSLYVTWAGIRKKFCPCSKKEIEEPTLSYTRVSNNETLTAIKNETLTAIQSDTSITENKSIHFDNFTVNNAPHEVFNIILLPNFDKGFINVSENGFIRKRDIGQQRLEATPEMQNDIRILQEQLDTLTIMYLKPPMVRSMAENAIKLSVVLAEGLYNILNVIKNEQISPIKELSLQLHLSLRAAINVLKNYEQMLPQINQTLKELTDDPNNMTPHKTDEELTNYYANIATVAIEKCLLLKQTSDLMTRFDSRSKKGTSK